MKQIMESITNVAGPVAEEEVDEHITGDKNQLDFTCKGEHFGGWVEIRSDDEVDVVVTHGDDEKVKKQIDRNDKQAIAQAAHDLACEFLNVDEDMLVPNSKSKDDELYDDEDENDEELDEFCNNEDEDEY